MCFVRFVHIEVSLIYEPIINIDLPQLVSYVFRKGRKRIGWSLVRLEIFGSDGKDVSLTS